MKKILWVLSVLIICACGSSKKKAAGTASGETIEQRLNAFLKVNDEMDFEKVLDYTYPKLFKEAPRSQLLKAMKEGFNNEEVKIELDSLKIITIHPEFKVGDASYARIKYSMIMLMDFKLKKDTGDASQADFTKEMLASQYGEENVSLDKATGIIRIRQTSDMVAVKDEYAKEWCFVNLKENDPMTDKLFSKEVQDKLATYH